jgi:hypothetical protein
MIRLARLAIGVGVVAAVAAIRAGTTYVNVHSSKHQGGEIRAQLESGHHD